MSISFFDGFFFAAMLFNVTQSLSAGVIETEISSVPFAFNALTSAALPLTVTVTF